MIRSFTTTALVGACFAGASVQAADVTFSGTVDAGYAVGLNTFENTPLSAYNLESNLGLDAKISDMLSVQLYATSLAGEVPGSFGSSRWPGMNFDGASLTWKLGEDQTLVVGDVVVAKGGISYYILKRYSSVTRVSAVRGASFTTGGLTVFGGADDVADSLFTVGGSYMASIDSSNSVEPAASIHFGGKDNFSWGGGLQYKGSFGEMALSASGSVYGGKNAMGDDVVGYALAVEPVYTTESFYVAGFGFFSPTGDDDVHSVFSYPVRHGRSYNPWAEDLTVYVEPGVNFAGGKAAFGLPIEYHEANLDIDDNERTSLVPSLYFFPGEGATITLWAEGDKYSDPAMEDIQYSAGLETVFKF